MREKFNEILQQLDLSHLDLQLYSLKRGGATELFRQTGSFDEVVNRGRWESTHRAKLYNDTSLQEAAQLKPVKEEKLEKAELHLKRFLST